MPTQEKGHTPGREFCFMQDVTGKEITSKLLARVKEENNVTIYEYTTMTDILEENGRCAGISAVKTQSGEESSIYADYTILASGGIGGLYQHSTNFPHLTGDALEVAKKHQNSSGESGLCTDSSDYIVFEEAGQKIPDFRIRPWRRSSTRIIKTWNGFVDELLPRDVVTRAIREQMEKDGTEHVWLSMAPIDKETILSHFPNIYEHCLEEGYDVTKECIPVVPAQHYFMGGIWVDANSRTSMEQLFAVGETSCNGVHGANRLASNSLLESLVFAKRAAQKIIECYRQKVKESA